MTPKTTVRLPVIVLSLLVILAPACSEESIVVIEPEIVFDDPPDPELPDGFVATNRPNNPKTSYTLTCPLATVTGGMQNDNVIIGCAGVSIDDDCIASIDAPKFASVKVAESFMRSTERLIAVEVDGRVLGFPIRILVWHEVVNICWGDIDGSDRFTMLSYCPVVDVAMHFVDDNVTCGGSNKFGLGYGVSGLLYNGNLVVFKRQKTKTFFVQMIGGGLDPGCLDTDPVIYDMSFALFRRLFPRGRVLTEDTGDPPPQGYDIFDNPYGAYWLSNELVVNGLAFPVAKRDNRLRTKTPVYGVITPGGRKAYPTRGVINNKNVGSFVVNDKIGSNEIVVWNEVGFQSTAAFERVVDGQVLTFSRLGRDRQNLPIYQDEETESLWTFDGIAVDGPLKGERLAHVVGHRSFWFAWVAFWHETELHDFGGSSPTTLMY